MTLTRTPCELDKMSLFQDLKLKRRKVDSRCSSDGESVADTSTSSPDLVCPHSPKMEPVGAGPTFSPDSTPPTRHTHLDNVANEATHPSVFDGGGATTSVIRSLPTRSQSPPPIRPESSASPNVPPRPHSSPGRPVLVIATPHTPPPLPQQQHPPPPPPQQQQHCRVIEQSPQHLPPQRSVISSVPANVVQSQLWLQSSRINGVKPELIGGNLGATPVIDTKANQGRVVRQTPTVIMGEAGGVRTMIWSQPPLSLNSTQMDTPTHHPPPPWCPSSTSTSTSGSSTVTTEESAAQMLLTLGQRSPATTTTTCITKPLLPPPFTTSPLNMERLWAGDLTQLPANQQLQALNLSSPPSLSNPPLHYTSSNQKTETITAGPMDAPDEEDTPMICMICEDKATGLHYGIITCEGCKGFFKRTVQNRRVYTCVADGNCEITKAQRNRCQYCRFKKCIEQGMVLQAVREDRMPGGRNSGAVYNLYKVKYKKHKKASTNAAAANKLHAQQKLSEKNALLSPVIKAETTNSPGVPTHLVNGTILKTALTNPSEVVHLRQRLDSAVSSSRDRNFSIEYTLSMIQTLIDCDEFQDIATLRNLDDLLDHKSDLSEKLCQIGDSIVYKLVQWTKRLPFYLELPVEVHTRLLTHKWHELLVLTTSAYQAIHGVPYKETIGGSDVATGTQTDADFNQEVNNNLCTLQTCLTSMMGRPITMDQLRQDVGLMVEKITHVTLMFRRIKLSMEEYVCLKVITMLNQVRTGINISGSELESIQERYMTCLRAYTQHVYPDQPTRFQELLVRLPEVQSAAALLLESKMFYVPFLLNSAIQR